MLVVSTIRIARVDAQDFVPDPERTSGAIAIPKDAETAWLDPALTDAAAAIEFARKSAVTGLVHYPVSTRVNNAKNEGPELIEPFENPA